MLTSKLLEKQWKRADDAQGLSISSSSPSVSDQRPFCVTELIISRTMLKKHREKTQTQKAKCILRYFFITNYHKKIVGLISFASSVYKWEFDKPIPITISAIYTTPSRLMCGVF